jgi:hypothetical protein
MPAPGEQEVPTLDPGNQGVPMLDPEKRLRDRTGRGRDCRRGTRERGSLPGLSGPLTTSGLSAVSP